MTRINRLSSQTVGPRVRFGQVRHRLASAQAGLAALALAVASMATLPGTAPAQTESAAAADADARKTSAAGARRAAAQAYDQGTAAYLRGDYGRAAGWFETAHRLSPAAPALIQAVRAYTKAERLARALTLALRLRDEYPEDPRAVDLASELLDQHTRQLVRVTVDCDGCQVDLDGKLQESKEFFLEPGHDGEVTALFRTGELSETVSGEANQQLTLRFDAPPDLPPRMDVTQDAASMVGTARTAEADGGGLPPLLVYVSAVAAIGLGAATVASGINANDLGAEFDESVDTFASVGCDRAGAPMEACERLDNIVNGRFDRASDAELRTNILLGATIGAGILTGVLALVAQWGDDNDNRASGDRPGLGIGATAHRDGASATLGGTF